MRIEYSVKDAVKYLRDHGVNYTEVHFRSMIGNGKIKSRMVFNSRIIPKSELDGIVLNKLRKKP